MALSIVPLRPSLNQNDVKRIEKDPSSNFVRGRLVLHPARKKHVFLGDDFVETWKTILQCVGIFSIIPSYVSMPFQHVIDTARILAKHC
jgi:hypothetical protein